MRKVIILTLLAFLTSLNTYSQVIRFMAGIEKDMSATKQSELIRKSLPNHKVILYRRGEHKRLIRDSYKDTSSVIILFSAGCKDSYSVIESVLCDVWLVEPHFSYGGNIRRCISIGFPRSRVIVGPYKERGMGISEGCRRTPVGLGHFDSLVWVCGLVKKNF
jgi:hypothetical protein